MKSSGKIVKTILISLLLSAIFAGCTYNTETENRDGVGTLTVTNGTSHDIVFVCWKSGGTVCYFEQDEIYDYELNKTVKGLFSGSSMTIAVPAGSSPLYFFLAEGGTELRTKEKYTVKADASTEIMMKDDTVLITAG